MIDLMVAVEEVDLDQSSSRRLAFICRWGRMKSE